MYARGALWLLIAAGAGFVLYRQSALDAQLDALARTLGEASAQAQQPASGNGGAAAPKPHRSGTQAARLNALEKSMARLRAEIRALEQATGNEENLVSDQQILSVMKDHGSKVTERQIGYHRERWLEQREEGLADFSKRYNLTREQSDALWGLLSREIDGMIEILRDPASSEDPQHAAEQWKKLLVETDIGAHETLGRTATVAWDQMRWLERKILWPWLPD